VIAFLFAGQGVELPWVDAALLREPAVAALVALASEHAGADVAHLLARGGRELERCEIVQPAFVAVCLGVHRLLDAAGVRPDVVLGHSLGELTAWAAAGGIACEDAVAIAARRGRLMAREAARHPGGMLRVKGDRAVVERALAVGREAGWICIAACNGPDEHAVSGDDAALARVAAHFPATRLAVAGAWHSPAMADAVDELAEVQRAVARRPMRARFVANRDGAFAHDDDVPDLLVGQLVRPVEFVASLATLVDAGVRRWLAVGPGKMIRALVHRNVGVACDVEMIDSLAAVARSARA
jgi:acyl transferase domain-containing protein